MPQIARFVGIDVGADRLDVHIAPDDITFAVDNTPDGWTTLARRLAEAPVARICLEATGGYEADVLDHLHAQGHLVCRLNPAEVRAFAKALRRRAKSDRADAKLLARLASIVEAQPYQPNPEAEALAEIVGYRRRVVDDITALQNQARRFRDPWIRASIAERLDQLRRCRKSLDARIAKALRGPDAPELAGLLLSVPGVGNGLAAMLLARLPELGALGHRQIAALVGVAPFERQSGKYLGQSKIAGGRADVRCRLYMATLSAVQHNKPLAAFYNHLLQKGKPKKLALTAAMRKLLTILNAIAASRQPWKQTA